MTVPTSKMTPKINSLCKYLNLKTSNVNMMIKTSQLCKEKICTVKIRKCRYRSYLYKSKLLFVSHLIALATRHCLLVLISTVIIQSFKQTKMLIPLKKRDNLVC